MAQLPFVSYDNPPDERTLSKNVQLSIDPQINTGLLDGRDKDGMPVFHNTFVNDFAQTSPRMFANVMSFVQPPAAGPTAAAALAARRDILTTVEAVKLDEEETSLRVREAALYLMRHFAVKVGRAEDQLALTNEIDRQIKAAGVPKLKMAKADKPKQTSRPNKAMPYVVGVGTGLATAFVMHKFGLYHHLIYSPVNDPRPAPIMPAELAAAGILTGTAAVVLSKSYAKIPGGMKQGYQALQQRAVPIIAAAATGVAMAYTSTYSDDLALKVAEFVGAPWYAAVVAGRFQASKKPTGRKTFVLGVRAAAIFAVWYTGAVIGNNQGWTPRGDRFINMPQRAVGLPPEFMGMTSQDPDRLPNVGVDSAYRGPATLDDSSTFLVDSNDDSVGGVRSGLKRNPAWANAHQLWKGAEVCITGHETPNTLSPNAAPSAVIRVRDAQTGEKHAYFSRAYYVEAAVGPDDACHKNKVNLYPEEVPFVPSPNGSQRPVLPQRNGL